MSYEPATHFIELRVGVCRLVRIVLAAWLLCWPATSEAQTVEVTPFYGYRAGGDFFEIVSGQPVDLDGTKAVGGVVNVKFNDTGMFAEALYTHQEARFRTAGGLYIPSADWRITVDHYMGGGTQEYRLNRRVRPFLTGLLGLTRYAAEGDNEIRFAVSAGGGVKLMPARWIGLRLDGRVFTTFADFEGESFGCSSFSGVCFVGFDADVVWQAEASVGLVVAFW